MERWRNVLIIVAIAAAVAFLPGGGTGASIVGSALSTLITVCFVLFFAYLYRERRMDIDGLGDRWKLVLYSALGAMVLLFANAFAAYATPYALTSGQISVVPVLIGQFIRGDVLANPHQGHALALGMIVVIALSTGIYTLLQCRAARWTR